MRTALFLLLLGASGCVNPASLKGLFSYQPPDIFESLKNRPPLFKATPPEEIEFIFPSDAPLKLTVRAPTGGWTQSSLIREMTEGISSYSLTFTHAKTGAQIFFVASTWGGDDVFTSANSIRGVLTFMGIPVVKTARTKYQGLDDWSIHRADYGCLILPMATNDLSNWLTAFGCAELESKESVRKKTVLVSFHDPRLTQAASSVKLVMQAQWPKSGGKTVNRALYELSAFARVKSGL